MSLASFSVAKPAAFGAQAQLPARQARRMQRCYAADDKRGIDFAANKNASLGYTEADSAGQTNIFAVEPKQYVSGSKTDAAVGAGNETFATASVAGSVAVGAVIAGLLLNSGPASLDAVAPTGDFVPLSTYASQFVAELATVPASAPALSE